MCVENPGVGSVCTNIRRRAPIHRHPSSTGSTTVRPRFADGRTASLTRTSGVSALRPMVNSRIPTAKTSTDSSARELEVCLSELTVYSKCFAFL